MLLGGNEMYDVLYLDNSGHEKLLASSLERDAAAALAREEARQRHGGRMFLSGSEQPSGGCMVLIVESTRTARAA
jgi:hypothetical protein